MYIQLHAPRDRSNAMLPAQALNSLRRAPAYALTIIFTLSLGLAAVGAMFALVHGVLLAPLPYPAPERLVSLQLELAETGRMAQSPAMFRTYQRHSTQLDEIALYRSGSANVWMGSAEESADHLVVSWVSASLMPLLRVAPLMGRTFSADEERRGGPDAVILSEAEWRQRFGAAADVIGRTLIVNDVPREVIGVMPAQFAFPDAGTRLWLPAKSEDNAKAGDFFYTLVARLAADATPASAQNELSAILPRMAEAYPQVMSGGSTAAWIAEVKPSPRVQALDEAMTVEIAPTLWMLAAVASLVMLAAWANAAHLALVRADARRQDVATRLALGASPLRASSHALVESLVMNAAAAVLAALAALVIVSTLRAFAPATLPRLSELGLGPWSVGFIMLVALLGSVILTLLQIRLATAPQLATQMSSGARSHTAGKTSRRVRAGVTIGQIAVALMVLVGASVLLRTAQHLREVQPGFEADQVSAFRLLLPFARYSDTARVAFYARLTEQVNALPSVYAAGLTAHLPLGSGQSPEQRFLRERESQAVRLPVNVIGDGYFAAMRIPLLAGRDFRPLETQRADEIIINQRTAVSYFSDPTGVESLGKTLRLDPGGPTYTIVGVVGDVRYDDLATPPGAMVYRPQVVANSPANEPGPLPSMSLVVHADVPPDALILAVRGIVRELDASVPVFEAKRMDEVVAGSMARLTLILWVTTAAAVVTLLLGMIGLFGVMAYGIALRRREFGLRMALGASPDGIVRGVVWQGLVLASIGIVAGLILWTFAAPYLRSLIVGIELWNPLPLALAIALLSGTALLASWLPARRAAAIDPAHSLRAG